MGNPFRKTADINAPYAVFTNPQGWEWRVLRTYKGRAGEDKDAYARWFVAARSPLTYGDWELGDTYKQEVLRYGRLQACTPEWAEVYK